MKIKVKIEYTVEVDVKDWAEEYSTEPTAAAVREDVKDYFNDIQHCPIAEHGAYNEAAVRIIKSNRS